MIVEAGYDLHQLLQLKLSDAEEGRRGLWLLALDKDLRYLFTGNVADNMTEPVETYADEIASALRNEPPYQPRYYVLAHSLPHLGERCDGCLYDGDELLRAAAPLRPYELLGRLVFDGDLCCSSFPRYSFRDYPGCENLPRAAVIAGPHGWGCACLACTQHRDTLAENQKKTSKHQILLKSKDENHGDD